MFFDFVMSFGTAGSGMTTSSVLLVTSGTGYLTENEKNRIKGDKHQLQLSPSEGKREIIHHINEKVPILLNDKRIATYSAHLAHLHGDHFHSASLFLYLLRQCPAKREVHRTQPTHVIQKTCSQFKSY